MVDDDLHRAARHDRRLWLAGRQADTTALGAVRDAGQPAELPSPWVVDATVSGTGCFKAAEGLVLWRPTATAAADLAVLPADRSWNANTVWPAGEAQLAMPPEMPVEDGGTYIVEMGGVASAVVLHVLPEAVKNDKMIAGWLSAKGCERQARALAKTLN